MLLKGQGSGHHCPGAQLDLAKEAGVWATAGVSDGGRTGSRFSGSRGAPCALTSPRGRGPLSLGWVKPLPYVPNGEPSKLRSGPWPEHRQDSRSRAPSPEALAHIHLCSAPVSGVTRSALSLTPSRDGFHGSLLVRGAPPGYRLTKSC